MGKKRKETFTKDLKLMVLGSWLLVWGSALNGEDINQHFKKDLFFTKTHLASKVFRFFGMSKKTSMTIFQYMTPFSGVLVIGWDYFD